MIPVLLHQDWLTYETEFPAVAQRFAEHNANVSGPWLITTTDNAWVAVGYPVK